MSEPLFDPPTETGHEPQACERCSAGTWAAPASDDELRMRGWIVFDGKSVTGKHLHVRICPACQRKGSAR